jgi:hypothetical protein
MRVKLLQNPKNAKGFMGKNGAIFLKCEILDNYTDPYTRGSRHELNGEFLR